MTSLHTLGPAGTNCELAAQEWFAREGRPGTVVLHPTLEDAAEQASRTPGAALLVAVAYPNLHTLVYAHIGRLVLADSIITMTHNMVLARRPGVAIPSSAASHPAPAGLVPEGLAVRLVTSNTQAALDCAAGAVDACITTLPAMRENDLDLVRDFGPIAMAFTVHVRTERS
ncbi:MAG: bacilysin biosynthesis protein BacA [Acidimicrobiales bacterium]